MVQEIRMSLPYQSAFCTLKRKYPPVTIKNIYIIIYSEKKRYCKLVAFNKVSIQGVFNTIVSIKFQTDLKLFCHFQYDIDLVITMVIVTDQNQSIVEYNYFRELSMAIIKKF